MTMEGATFVASFSSRTAVLRGTATPRAVFFCARGAPPRQGPLDDPMRRMVRDWAVLQITFLAWKAETLHIDLERVNEECQKLAASIGKRTESMWHMRKADLVQVAMKDLGWTFNEANAARVGLLRLEIKENRQQKNAAEEQVDPLAAIPKGLAKLRQAELVEHMVARNLTLPPKNLREAMIRDILSDVDARKANVRLAALEGVPNEPVQKKAAPKMQLPKQDVEEDLGCVMAGEAPSQATGSGGVAPFTFRPWLRGRDDRGESSGPLREPQDLQDIGERVPARATPSNVTALAAMIAALIKEGAPIEIIEVTLQLRQFHNIDSAQLQKEAVAVHNASVVS